MMTLLSKARRHKNTEFLLEKILEVPAWTEVIGVDDA
jgi:hypothetical protein